jgi:hypothetical protein
MALGQTTIHIAWAQCLSLADAFLPKILASQTHVPLSRVRGVKLALVQLEVRTG